MSASQTRIKAEVVVWSEAAEDGTKGKAAGDVTVISLTGDD